MKSDDDVRIRAFSVSDYDDFIALWRSSGLTIKRSDSLAELKKLCALGSNRLLVAESIQGLIGAVIGAFDGRRAWIYHLAVALGARRCGVATRLVNEIEKHLKASGALKVNLLVEPENEKARQFYEALGFKEVPFTFLTKEF